MSQAVLVPEILLLQPPGDLGQQEDVTGPDLVLKVSTCGTVAEGQERHFYLTVFFLLWLNGKI